MPENFVESHDTSTMGRLYELAEPQCGLVTIAQAVSAGIARSSVEYHARPTGQLERCGRGLYRLRRFPKSEHAPLWRAYLPVAPGRAVVSHVSALWLLGLCARKPELVHLTLPRSERWRVAPRGARLHFSGAPPDGARVVSRHRLPVAIAEFALVSVMITYGLTNELEAVIDAALARRLITLQRLRCEWPPATLEQLERIAPERSAGPT